MSNQPNLMSLPIYNKTGDSDFSYIWRRVAATFKFTQLDTKPMDQKSRIIYENSSTSTYITITGQTQLFDRIYAIKDQVQHNRFFVGFDLCVYNTDYNITGIMVYFDSNGTAQITKMLNRVIYTYDIRNGKPNAYLYNQTLLFTMRHRDTSNLILGTTLLTYDDIILQTESMHTDIVMSRIKDSYSKPRFVFIKDISNSIYIFDLGSLKIVEKFDDSDNHSTNTGSITLFFWSNTANTANNIKKKMYLELNYFCCKSENELDSLDFKEMEYFGDGYKDLCIMCGNLTCIAECIGSEKLVFSNLGMGRSYCDRCKVRYSKTDKKWVCCRLNENAEFCSGEVWQNQPCMKKHSTTMTTQCELVCMSDASVKFPYKHVVSITRIHF